MCVMCVYKVVYTKRKFKSEDKYEISQSQVSVTEHGLSPVFRHGKRRVISGELFWRVIFMQIRLFIVMNLDSLQSQLSSNT